MSNGDFYHIKNGISSLLTDDDNGETEFGSTSNYNSPLVTPRDLPGSISFENISANESKEENASNDANQKQQEDNKNGNGCEEEASDSSEFLFEQSCVGKESRKIEKEQQLMSEKDNNKDFFDHDLNEQATSVPHEPSFAKESKKINSRSIKKFEMNQELDDSRKGLKPSRKIVHHKTPNYGEGYVPTLDHLVMNKAFIEDDTEMKNIPIVRSSRRENANHKVAEGEIHSDSSIISIPSRPGQVKKRVKLLRKQGRAANFKESDLLRLRNEEENKLNALVETELGLESEPLQKPEKRRRRITIKKISKAPASDNDVHNLLELSQKATLPLKPNKIKLKTKYSIRRWYGPRDTI